MKKSKLILITLFFLFSTAFANNKKDEAYGGKFTRIFGEINLKAKIDWNKFYPLNIGDFWEFIEKDTTTLFGITRRLNFSIAKEIIADTLLPNGMVYKKIKMWNCANSVNREIKYSFQRADSLGKIYTYLNNSDKLLYDLNKNKNETYPSPFENFFWKVLDKYYVVGFGDTLLAIDIALFDSTNVRKYSETIIENFGVVSYQGNLRDDYLNPEGRFWGAVINGIEYGSLIVLKQQVNWKEFYPLHVGDYWVYEGKSGNIPFIETHRIIGDTIMPDGNNYFLVDGARYERIDSLGNIYKWSNSSNSAIKIFNFSNKVGDTVSAYDLGEAVWRINNKYFYGGRSEIYCFLYPDLIYYGKYYTQGLGLVEWTIEGGWGILKGAYIDGFLFGDTTITSVKDKYSSIIYFALFQNYPNPFNSVTKIKYSIKEQSFITLKVFDLLGREIATLVNEMKQPGEYEVEFSAKGGSASGGNASKYELSSGVYLYQLKSGSYTATKKFVYLR